MIRFVTANEKQLWAAIAPDSRCAAPAVPVQLALAGKSRRNLGDPAAQQIMASC